MQSAIIFICDRSGSMADVKSDMEPAMNKFLDEQRALGEDTARLKMVMFDTEYEVAYDGLLKDATPFVLEPRGCTALLDAIGKTLGGFDPSLEPETKTIVVILTDGMENSSFEWKRPQIFDLIKKLDAQPNFSVTYLGANQNAIQEGNMIGVSRDASMDFSATSKGVRATAHAFSARVSAVRSGVANSVCYSEAERTAAKDGAR